MPSSVQRYVAVTMVVAAAAYALGRWRSSDVAPFRLWDFRAGTDFRSMNEQASREAGRGYSCAPLADSAAGRGCTLETAGIRGSVHLLLDPAERAIVIQFRSADSTRTMREELRKAAAQWATIVRPRTLAYPVADTGEFTATHFATADGAWSATIEFDERGADDVVTLRDERALARMHAAAPLSLLAHETLRYVNPMTDEQRSALTERVTQAGRPSPADAIREGAALALAAERLPTCVAASVDPDASPGVRGYEGPLSNEKMSRAASLAFPGSSLRLDAGAYFVNPDGRAESVMMSRTIMKKEDEGLAIFGITFLGRLERLDHLTEPAGAKVPECRALAQVIIVRLDDRGEVVGATAVPVVEGAIGSEISDIRIAHDVFDPRKESIEVRSRAGYAAAGWYGAIQWEEWMPLEAQPRVRARGPAMLSVQRGGLTMGGQVNIDLENSSVAEVRFDVTGIVEETSAVFTRTIIVPRNGGYIDGWTLLLSL